MRGVLHRVSTQTSVTLIRSYGVFCIDYVLDYVHISVWAPVPEFPAPHPRLMISCPCVPVQPQHSLQFQFLFRCASVCCLGFFPFLGFPGFHVLIACAIAHYHFIRTIRTIRIIEFRIRNLSLMHFTNYHEHFTDSVYQSICPG